MKDLSFARGVAYALGFAFVSSVAMVVAAQSSLSFHALVFLLVPSLSFVYLLCIGQYRVRKSGWISSLSIWCVFTFLLWLLSPSLTDYALLHVAAVSVMRGLFFHKNFASVLMDFTLSLFALGAAFWAVSHTGSIFLSVWCFFLVQAAFVLLPGFSREASTDTDATANSQQFDMALRKAEEALRKVANQ